MNEAGPDLYDPVELRRRIVLFFSVGELRALADALGLGGIAWERGIHEAAREVVRQSERYAGLPALVARLREAKPQVEWGEGLALAPPPPASAAPSAPPLADPYAPPPGPPAIQVPLAPAWPGVTSMGREPRAASGGVDPRIFVAVAGLMVAAVAIAYFAGRASSAPGSGDATPVASASAPRSAHSDGPAALAADAIGRSFANLARVCELPSSAGVNTLVFARVFERCGPSAPSRRSSATPAFDAGAGTAEPTGVAGGSAEPTSPRGRRPGRGGDQAPGEAPAAKGCMGGCDAQHSGCRARCGPEPTESSAYDGYQRCLGRCLSDASRCRLGCR